jgi:general secretion pathway protein D
MKRTVLLTIIALSFWGCSTFTQNYKLGSQAALNKDWDEAIGYFESAVKEDPKNEVYRLSLLRAKLAASYAHLNKARELASREKTEEALAEYEKALSYGVLDKAVADEARALTEEKVKEKKPREIKIEPPLKLKASEEKIALKFPVQTSLRSIFQALGKAAGVDVVFDDALRDVPFSIDLADKTFEQALSSLCLATKNFYSVVDEKTIIIAPDLPQKRAQYELNAIKTFYLSNINAEEIRGPLQQILTTQYRRPQILVDKSLNSITLRETPAVVELAERLIRAWDKAKGEVIIDLEIMEVSRVKLRQLGMELEKNLIGLRYSGAEASEEGWFNLKDIDFSKKENFQIALPAAILQFLESDSATKIISQPRLRGIEGEEISYVVGDEIPIIRTYFSPIAAGGIAQQPVVNYEYKNVGIDVKIKPRIHAEREITLELDMKIKSLSGATISDIPVISTREVKNVIRLKDGETNLLAGLLKDEERKISSGVVGLKNIPILGGLLSSTDQTIQQTDVILTITPYIVRSVSITAEDFKPLWVAPEGISTSETAGGILTERELIERRAAQRVEQAEAAQREQRGQNRVFLNPPSSELPQNRELRLNVQLSAREDVASMSLSISFDPKVVKLKEIRKGGFLNQLGADVPFLSDIDNSSGVSTIGFSSPELGKGIKGSGILATLIFESQQRGECFISITNVSANASSGEALSFESGQSRVVVR